MRIAVAQLSPTTDRSENLERVASLLDQAAAEGVRLVVLPELFSVPFVPSLSAVPDPKYYAFAEPLEGPSNEMIATKTAEHHLIVVSSIFEASTVVGTFHNTACVFENGKRLLVYRKSHLPFSRGFPEKAYFTPGHERPAVVATSVGNLGLLICYERHYPELARLTALSGAQILCVPIASASSTMGEVFHLELRAHATFNGVFVAAANRTGVEGDKHYFGGSIICGPRGEVLGSASDVEKNVLVVADVDVSAVEDARIDRPFLRDRRPELYQDLTR